MCGPYVFFHMFILARSIHRRFVMLVQAFEQKVQAAHAAVHYKAWLAFSTWGADEDEEAASLDGDGGCNVR